MAVNSPREPQLSRIVEIAGGIRAADVPVELIVKYYGDLPAAAAGLEGETELLSPSYAIVTLPLKNVDALYQLPEIEYVELPKNLSYYLRTERRNVCATVVQDSPEWQLDGSGVLVGIIDSGIDYRHPDFRAEDGTTRILQLWDQTIPGAPPPGFRQGSLYTAEQINQALQSDTPYAVVPSQDTAGHGTAVAGIAAGNGRAGRGTEKGIAPGAGIAVVKLGNSGLENKTRTTEIMRGAKFIADLAESLRMPCAINLSYGTNNGSHTGRSLFELYLDSVAERGKSVLVVATGNEGDTGHHYSALLKPAQETAAEFVISGNQDTVYFSLWKSFLDTVPIQVVAPDGSSTGVIQPTQSVTRMVLEHAAVAVLYGQPTEHNAAQEVYIRLQSTAGRPIAQGLWKIVMTGSAVVDGQIDIWMSTQEEVASQTAFLQPDAYFSLTLPSTAYTAISVGGYQSELDSIASFSGRGSNRSEPVEKPDLTAPAVRVISAAVNGGYNAFTGTSIAAPFVTGAAALMMQWGIVQQNDPFLYNQRLKAFLRQGAQRSDFSAYPNPLWGCGRLSVCNAMNQLRRYSAGGGGSVDI